MIEGQKVVATTHFHIILALAGCMYVLAALLVLDIYNSLLMIRVFLFII